MSMRWLSEWFFAEKQNLPLFLPVILGFGIIFGVFFPYEPGVFHPLSTYFIPISLLIIFLFLSFNKRCKYLAIIALVFTTGFWIIQTGSILNVNLRKLLIYKEPELLLEEVDPVQFTAIVKFIDETHPTMKNMRRIAFSDMKFRKFDREYMVRHIKTAKMTCSVKASENIMPNDVVFVKGKISPYKLAAIPNAFDQRQYNALINLDATGIVYFMKKIGHAERKIDLTSNVRRVLTQRIVAKMGPIEGGLASALLTGDKSPIPQDIREKYINSGTAHILAISGLHMSIIAMLIFLISNKILQYIALVITLIRKTGIINSKKYAAIITIPVTAIYLGLSGASPSATRAFIMTTIFLCSIILGRKVLSLRSVAFAAFVILLIDPGSLFLVSFQLSFSAVVALISFYDVVRCKYQEYQERCQSWSKQCFFYVTTSAITTTIASIATFPISVAAFNRFSISGILGNIIAIPAVSFVVMPLGLTAIATGAFTNIFVSALKYVLSTMTDILGKISTLPGSVLTIRSPSIELLYGIMIGGIVLSLMKTKCRLIGAVISIASGLMWILETSPDIVIPPNSGVICFVEDGKFCATNLQKSRLQVKSVQRNLGFDGKITKKPYQGQFNLPLPQGLYIWSATGKHKQLSKQKHPYCPAHYNNIAKNR